MLEEPTFEQSIPRTWFTMPLDMTFILRHFDRSLETIMQLYESDELLWSMLAQHVFQLTQEDIPPDRNAYLKELMDVYVGALDGFPDFVSDMAWFDTYLQGPLTILSSTLRSKGLVVGAVNASTLAATPANETIVFIFECVPINTAVVKGRGIAPSTIDWPDANIFLPNLEELLPLPDPNIATLPTRGS